MDVHGWSSYLRAGFDNSLILYYRLRPGSGDEQLRRIATQTWVQVLFRSPDGRETFEVSVTPDGFPTGFRRRNPPTGDVADSGEPAARVLATAALSKWALPAGSRLSEPEVTEDRGQDAITRRYVWKVQLEARPEVDLSYTAEVSRNKLSAERFNTTLSEDFLRAHKLEGGIALRVNGRRVSGLTLVTLIIYYLAIAIVFILGLYRFVQRARQRELSYQRIAVLTFVIATLFLSVILLTDVASFANASQSAPIWPVFVFGTLSYIFMGLIVAAAYGSGEGDIREAYPGKLTSLDALLTGRVFSRNVARSVVMGAAFGGWGLLLANLVPFFWRNSLAAGTQIELLDFIVSRVPWLSPLVIWPFDVVFTSVIGLLLPLPFLRRRLKNPRTVLLLLTIYAWVAGTGAASSFTPWTGAALIGVVKAAILLVPFFRFDLLTALVALAAPTFVSSSIHLVAQPSASLSRAGLISLGIGLTFLAIEFFFSYRGRLLREEEIGPQYARFLAERLSMQAEVSAAREAQIRLLPQTLPQSRQFMIAAECRPAHEVGGDFYEVFQLDDDRLGIFMAEGGGKGLASALSIAFAKGFLLPKITGPARGDDSPVEIVRSLQSRIKQTLDSDANMGIVYAVIDSSDMTVRYARTGAYPRMLVGRTDANASASEALEPQEMETKFKVPAGSREQSPETFSVISGITDVKRGDYIVFFTDGLATALSESGTSPSQSVWRSISNEEMDSYEKLQKSVQTTIESTSKRAQKAGLADDLTTLVVRVNP